MNPLIYFFSITLLCACAAHKTADKSDSIMSMQILDRNGFTETISNKERIDSFKQTDFFAPQPFQKVLRVYGRDPQGQTVSKITSYHDNGEICQYLEAINGRAHGVYKEWHPNGQLKVQTAVVEGAADLNDLAQASWVFDGLCEVWDDQGNRIAEFHYDKGLLKETGYTFFPGGKIQTQMPYEQGELHGCYRLFDAQGGLLEEVPYFKGEKQGKAKTYWPEGSLLSEEEFEEGKLESASYFDPKGTLVATVEKGSGHRAEFQKGVLFSLSSIKGGLPEGEVQVFYPDGSLHCSYTMSGGKKQGTEWEYYPGAKKPKLCIEWHEDVIQGQVKTWYLSGQMESQREVHQNKKQGSAFAWYKSGDLMLIEEYENDLLVKGSYYKKGDKKAVSKIEAGKGTAHLYTPEGILSKKIPYEKGRPLFHNDSIN
jgi:antitoxin component YwqK of YwqJK toxin-antitoxin module